MKREQIRGLRVTEHTVPLDGIRLGRIVSIDEVGNILVDFTANKSGPIVARVTSSARSKAFQPGNPVGREVLLTFENNDPQCPIIVDTMYSLIDEITEPATTLLEAEEAQEIIVDGKRISFVAEEEIVLKCGKASITLTKAGKILIKGEYVLSHSSGENRLRGGSVSIN